MVARRAKMQLKFHIRLKLLIDECGLTATKLAKELHMSASQICSYLNQTKVPRAGSLIKIKHYFNVSMDFLLGLSEDRKYTGKYRNTF